MNDIYDQFVDDLINKDISVRKNVPGSELTTYRVGGEISYLVTLSSTEDIENLSLVIKQGYEGMLNANNVAVVGKGSNLIIDDAGFDGFVFMLSGMLSVFDDTQDGSNNTVSAYAGTALPVLARQSSSHGLSGLEFYVGIPGTVGGAVAMNAGGHGKQTSDVLVSTDVLDLTSGVQKIYDLNECNFEYRKSRFVSTDLVISAKYSVTQQDPKLLKSKLDEIVSWRRENQPGGRNVGSVFQNPPEISAGTLIEKCGLKGYRLGGAFVSEKHANFIQAEEDATSADIIQLIEHIQQVVSENTGYELQTEVRYIGARIDEQ